MKKKNSIRYLFAKNAILFLFCLWICNPSLLCYGEKASSCDNPDKITGQPFSFGVIADIQYADKDSLRGRYFRPVINKLEECIADLNTRNLSFTIQLGDIIDGHKDNLNKTHEDLDSVVGVINHLKMPVYHIIGNHDMVAGKEYLQTALGMRQFYYDFTMPSATGWHFIVLDGNDGGYGIIGEEQINWFRSVLNKAKESGEKVVCFCHYALTQSAAGKHYMAKPGPILEILDNNDCVVAWFAGHDHNGGYDFRNGIHHITIKGMVETPPENSYAIVELFPDKIRIIGIVKEVSRELPLKNEVNKRHKLQIY